MRSRYSSCVRRLSFASANSLLVKGALLAALLLLSNSSAVAANWNTNGTGVWNLAGNWSTGAIPGIGTATVFKNNTTQNDGNGIGHVGFTAAASAASITFNNAGGGTQAFTFDSGQTLTLATGMTNNTVQTETFANAITLSGAQNWNATSGSLAFTGNIANGGFLLTLKGGNNFTFSSTSVVSGSGGLTVNDSGGVATLNAANTYSGNTTITAGTLQVGSISGTTATLGAGTYAGTITDSTSGTLEYSSGVGQTLSGVISGSGALIKDTSNSTLTLSNNNTYTGNITINGGTLQVSNSGSLGTGSGPYTYAGTITDTSGALEYSSSATQTLSGNITGGGAVIKDISSTSDLTLSGTNTFTGGLKLDAGTVTVNLNSNLGGAANILTFGGGTLEVATSMSLSTTLGTAHQIVVGANSTGTLQIDSGLTLTLGTGSVLTASNTVSTLIVNGVNGVTPNQGNLILGANQTFIGTFDLNNAKLSLSGFSLTVGVLEITGNCVIDFGGSGSSSILSATGLIVGGVPVSVVVDASSSLTVNNWNDEKEYFYSADDPTAFTLNNISWGVPYNGDTTKWLTYADGPGPGHQITPVPEPATYGAIFTAATLGLFFWFRLKANAPRLVPVCVAVQT